MGRGGNNLLYSEKALTTNSDLDTRITVSAQLFKLFKGNPYKEINKIDHKQYFSDTDTIYDASLSTKDDFSKQISGSLGKYLKIEQLPEFVVSNQKKKGTDLSGKIRQLKKIFLEDPTDLPDAPFKDYDADEYFNPEEFRYGRKGDAVLVDWGEMEEVGTDTESWGWIASGDLITTEKIFQNKGEDRGEWKIKFTDSLAWLLFVQENEVKAALGLWEDPGDIR